MRHLLLAIALVMALAGCGNKGPLYLPPEPAAEPAVTPNPAP